MEKSREGSLCHGNGKSAKIEINARTCLLFSQNTLFGWLDFALELGFGLAKAGEPETMSMPGYLKVVSSTTTGSVRFHIGSTWCWLRWVRSAGSISMQLAPLELNLSQYIGLSGVINQQDIGEGRSISFIRTASIFNSKVCIFLEFPTNKQK